MSSNLTLSANKKTTLRGGFLIGGEKRGDSNNQMQSSGSRLPVTAGRSRTSIFFLNGRKKMQAKLHSPPYDSPISKVFTYNGKLPCGAMPCHPERSAESAKPRDPLLLFGIFSMERTDSSAPFCSLRMTRFLRECAEKRGRGGFHIRPKNMSIRRLPGCERGKILLRYPVSASPVKTGLRLTDRCHSLRSLFPPQAALPSLPLPYKGRSG